MNTVSTTEHPESPAEEPRDPAEGRTPPGAEAPASPGESPAAPDEVAAGPAGEEESVPSPESSRTAIYVRRGRTPALGFWVLLSFVVPAIVALLVVPLFQFGDLRVVVNFVLLAMVVVGLPLAAIASFIDARRHRGEGRRRR